MALLLLTIAFPFILFIGGSYILHYPVTLGALYGFNMAMIYLVGLGVSNQMIKVFTQKLEIAGDNLILARKQIFGSFPIIRELNLEVPLDHIAGLTLQPTRVGYLMKVNFQQDGKRMGADLDINPLENKNRSIINELFSRYPKIETDETTRGILSDYDNKILSWRGTYMFSLAVIGIALAVFFMISLYIWQPPEYRI